jgi:hypothetical protein
MPGTSNRRSRIASPGSRLERRACQNRRRSGAWFVSIALHVLVLGLLASAGALEPGLPVLEVFTAEPERDPATPTPIAPQPPTVQSAKPRPARAARSMPPSIQPVAPKTSTEAAIPRVNAPVRERGASDNRPRDGDSAGHENVPLALASAPVSALTLTPAKTLTAIEPPSEAEPVHDGALMAKTNQPSDVIAEASAVPALLPSGESPTESPRAGTPGVSDATHSLSSSSAPTVAAQTTNERPGRPAPEAMVRAASRGSALSVGLQPLEIRVDGFQERTTSRATDVISGVVVGGEPRRLQLQLGDAVTTPTVDGRAFSATVSLKPGLNRVRVVAADSVGREAEETVSIQYNTPIGVVITGPVDGYTIRSSDPPLVVVQGEVDDPSVTAVSLIAGAHHFSVPVTAGRFRHLVPVLESTVRVRVETPPADNRTGTSATVTVHGTPTPTMAVLLYWPNHSAMPVELAAAWRPRSDRVDDTVQRIPLGTAQDNTGLTMYYLRNPRPGVYTFVLTSTASDAQSVQPAVYVPGGNGGLKILPTVTLDGTQRLLVARVLLPHGVLWEQDNWFSGQSANGNILTKFRFPDGISWSERAGAPR